MECPPISPFSSFDLAAQAVLRFLHERIDWQLWMFTRVQGNDWIVLQSNDRGYGVTAGDVFKWSDSFCFRMVQGLGPQIAPRSQEIAAYLEAPIGTQVQIGAYIGIPLKDRDGGLFGTLCAIDPTPKSDEVLQEIGLIELQSQLLATILHYELAAQESIRRYERAEAAAQQDALTGIYNRYGWNKLILAEEERCRRYGHSASIVICDLDNLKRVNDTYGHSQGDLLIQNTARCLCKAIRKGDIVARLGGDEFAILFLETSSESIEKLVARIEDQLAADSIPASVGWATRSSHSNLSLAIEEADRKMLQRKFERKQCRREVPTLHC